MSESKHVTEAHRVAREAADTWRIKAGFRPSTNDPFPRENMEGSLVTALDAAGLLRTGLEKRAIEACERHYTVHGVSGHTGPCNQASEVGRESLQSRKPQPRWKYLFDVADKPLPHCVLDGWPDAQGSLVVAARFRNESEARAYADHRNKLDAEGK